MREVFTSVDKLEKRPSRVEKCQIIYVMNRTSGDIFEKFEWQSI